MGKAKTGAGTETERKKRGKPMLNENGTHAAVEHPSATEGGEDTERTEIAVTAVTAVTAGYLRLLGAGNPRLPPGNR